MTQQDFSNFQENLSYFIALKECLGKLSPQEQDEAISYYQEYAEDAELFTHEAVEAQFGSPKELASKIYAEHAIKTLSSQEPKRHKRAFGIGLLALFSLPITGPLFIVFLTVIVCLLVVAFSVIISFGATAIGLFGGAIALVLNGIIYWSDGGLLALTKLLGGATIMLAFSALFCWLTLILTKGTMKITTLGASKIIKRRKSHE